MKGHLVIWVTLVISATGLACGSASTPGATTNSSSPDGNSTEPSGQVTEAPAVATATEDPNLVAEGTYLVGTEIQPGIYRGNDPSCYWARLKGLSGNLEDIIANDNAAGQFYVEIKEGDKAFDTGCAITKMPDIIPPTDPFPTKLDAGMYLVNIDIQPGTYKGQAEGSSCYWARLSHVAGTLDSIIANDNAEGQFYVEVAAADFALQVACAVERVSD